MNDEIKKIKLPGDHLSSGEEAEPGENCHLENDEIYSSAVGMQEKKNGKITILPRVAGSSPIKIGVDVYCLIAKTSQNNAIAECISAVEFVAGKKERNMTIDAVLPVSSVRNGYVEDIRQEVKIGDIIKARIHKFTKTGAELSMLAPEYGLIKVFCPKCRGGMHLKEDIFICNCGWKERRKIPKE